MNLDFSNSLGPNCTLATQTVSGTKKSKDITNITLTTRKTKVKPFVITKVDQSVSAIPISQRCTTTGDITPKPG